MNPELIPFERGLKDELEKKYKFVLQGKKFNLQKHYFDL